MEINTSPIFFKQIYQHEMVYYPHMIDTFKVWILLEYPTEKLAPEASLAFLEKVLGAIQLQNQHFRISNVSPHTDWKNYAEVMPTPYTQVWAFGVPLQKVFSALPAQPNYTPFVQENITYLQADSLEQLQNNAELKKQLWGVLQQIAKN